MVIANFLLEQPFGLQDGLLQVNFPIMKVS